MPQVKGARKVSNSDALRAQLQLKRASGGGAALRRRAEDADHKGQLQKLRCSC